MDSKFKKIDIFTGCIDRLTDLNSQIDRMKAYRLTDLQFHKFTNLKLDKLPDFLIDKMTKLRD